MSSFVKDDTGFIINTDDSHYRAILAARENEKRAKEAEQKFNRLEEELSQIKELLKKIK